MGSCNEEVAQSIIYALMDRSESELGEPLARLLPLGLGLLYLGKQVFQLYFPVDFTLELPEHAMRNNADKFEGQSSIISYC